MRIALLILFSFFFSTWVKAQVDNHYQRSSLYFYYGTSGGNLRDFDEMLESRGAEELKNNYHTFGMGYQNRFNDFILGAEIYQNNGVGMNFRDYKIDYRTTRIFLNVGYSFTEEGKFHLIHYMSMGLGSLNFEMLQHREPESINDFLTDPARGYILRKNNLHKGSQYFGVFLTEIGFQMGYDLIFPPYEEVITLMSKFGYSFNPFEDSWVKQGVSFDNIQSGAFFRIGAGISLPKSNYFYRDASLSAQLIYGLHFTRPSELNQLLEQHGWRTFSGIPKNWGAKILGENRGNLYGVDLYNLALSNQASDVYEQTLNSIRIYGNIGKKLYERKNFELSLLGGLGYGQLRYSMLHLRKLDFPGLMDIPNYDGELKKGGLMAKPEFILAYAMPLSKKKSLDIIYSVNAGYEMPIGNYKLADLKMTQFMNGPYVQFGLGVRP
ncbi:hypothetical protein QWY93_17190 [Echinicola jeungdonensis]|uniref:DUF5723 domain-containing protein n=1 Tax=Echinicola jeungdonensis TaxID=709343 RepID=A0ABV5J428_9BACT|nr:hypothetical protein [Echinicola jeungdonensis]MDN3671052.1 hypothetical protein [Echinicola jeungdonensis]